VEEVLFPLQGTHHSGCLLLPTTGGGTGEEVREGGREGRRGGGSSIPPTGHSLFWVSTSPHNWGRGWGGSEGGREGGREEGREGTHISHPSLPPSLPPSPSSEHAKDGRDSCQIPFPLRSAHYFGCLLFTATSSGAWEEVRKGGREGRRGGGSSIPSTGHSPFWVSTSHRN